MSTLNLGRIKPVNKGTWSNSTAYAIDDFVQYTDNGVLSTYIAVATSTNQTPSTSGTENSTYWKFLAKGVADSLSGIGNNKIVTTDGSGNVQALAIGSANQFLQTNSSANGFQFGDVTSAIRKLTMFNDATYNINTSSSSVSFPITLDFVKAQADSDIFIQGWTPLSNDESYRVGERMRIQKVVGSAFDDTAGGSNAPNTEIYGGNNFISPADSDDGIKGRVDWSRRIDTSTETFFNSAETYRIHLGWASRNGSAQRLAQTWNPQNSSARDRQSSTQIWVWELDPSTTAFIT